MRDLNFNDRPTLISLTDDNRLKPCSKCGSKPVAHITKNFLQQKAAVGCVHCGGTINILHHGKYEGDIESEIIKEWNND